MDTCLDEGSVAMVSWLPRTVASGPSNKFDVIPNLLPVLERKGPVHKVMRQAAGTLWICDIGVSFTMECQ